MTNPKPSQGLSTTVSVPEVRGPTRLRAIVLCVCVGMLAGGGVANAQTWPTRPVTMVIPFAAGGPMDTVGRVLAPRLSEVLDQQVVIENLGGAGGMTGSARVAKATPDGYQFLLGNVGTHAVSQTLYKTPLYNAATDFAPVALVAELSLVLLARKDLLAGNLPEFIAYAKANQAKMQFGSGGAGSATHLACALLNAAVGVDVTHVPYRGGAPAMQDLIAGRIDYMCVDTPLAIPQLEGNTLKGIAVLTRARTPSLPALASAHEQGLRDFEAANWSALFMPKGTPAPVIAKLNAAAVAAMNTSAIQQRFKDNGVDLVAPERRSPDYLAKFVDSEIAKWAGPIKAAGVSAD
jgi:tripartite-type tricarboxylate transporter receptor subunit TctC